MTYFPPTASLKQLANEAIGDLRSLRDFIRWGSSRFAEADVYFGHGTDNAYDEAVWLALHAVHLPLDTSAELFDTRLTHTERRAVVELIMARIESRKPAAYLTGEGWFCGLPFHVNDEVLVPRSPIGQLVEAGFEPWLESGAVDSVLDLCTGSGCIGIACAYAFPEAEVVLSDIHEPALETAQRNVTRHGLDERVTVLGSDVFENIPGQTFSLIVSNPPYVDQQDMEALPEEYRQEPELALAAGEDGLDIVRRILGEAKYYLADDGLLVVEVGNSEEALMQAYPDVDFIWPDFSRGGHGVFVLTAEQLRAIP
ncbi:MAG: 50S ribosomal protein L3 N(5)-glutamine methyltransferase [bacterium]